MTVITGPILDSAGQPAKGFLYVEQWYRSELNGTLVTDNPAKGIVENGELFLDDGVTPLEIPASPLGGGTRMIEDFRPFTRQVVRNVIIPENGPVQYATLQEVSAPIGSSTFIIPGALRSFVEKADGVADALAEARAAVAIVEAVAEEVADVEANTVSTGTVVGDNLILTRTDGTTNNAGNVRGPQGAQGLPGPGAVANDDANEALIKTPGTKTATALSATNVQYKQAAKNPDLLIVGAINRNSFGAVTSAAVLWPDGKPGVFTTDVFSTAFPGAIDSYHITHVNGGTTLTYTQPTITRDSNGAATNVPQIVVN
jgi:hypothetical protein